MTVLQIGSIKFNLIVRDTLYGIRFRDINSDLVKTLKGLKDFLLMKAGRLKQSLKLTIRQKKFQFPMFWDKSVKKNLLEQLCLLVVEKLIKLMLLMRVAINCFNNC